jgi:hypothetical protein
MLRSNPNIEIQNSKQARITKIKMTQNKMVISMMLHTAAVSVIGTPALWNAAFRRPSSGGFHRVKISYLFRISCF